MELRFVSAEDIRSRLDILALIEALRAGHLDDVPMMERVLMTAPASSNSFLVWHAWGPIIASKLVTVFPGNPRLRDPRPSVQALITAFDGETGSPVALVDGTELTYWKTAASSGLAADILAPPEPHTMVMVGAGGLAPYLIHAHLGVRPSIRRVLVWNRTRERAERMIEALHLDTAIEFAEDLAGAVGEAQLISCATASSTPLLRGEWIGAGSHVDLVGGYTPQMREADDETIRRAKVFVDASMFTIDHCGDIAQPIADGIIGLEDIHADLFGLCRGEHPGRVSPHDITLYKSGGGAHLDLMATMHVLEVFS